MSARAWLFLVTATILVAAAVHLGTVYAVPRLIMMRVMAKMGEPNVMHYGKRPDSSARAVVRPSPDILYASCPFDLSAGPLKVTAAVPHDNYWSVSAFDAATDNFYVKNDRQIAGKTLEIVFLKHGQALPHLDGATESDIVFAPSTKGIVLFRTVIQKDADLPKLSALLHQSHCMAVAPALR
jgi:uncharacterized membrane protein